MSFQYIDRSDQLAGVVSACAQVDVLTIDTEFIRIDTYYPIVGLVQIYNGEECFIIDPLAVDLRVLAPVFTDPNITKVFHACSEDLEIFQHSLGLIPYPLFDTQIAAAVLGVAFSMGYQNLVNHYLDVIVPKEETRSNWLQRPLTKGQIDYAAMDVIHLYQVYLIQKETLLAQNRLSWVEEECVQMGVDIPTMIDPNEFYKRVRGAQKLSPRQLHVFRALCAWREIQARRQDKPRNRIIDEKTMMLMARQLPTDKHQLSDIGLSSRQLRRYGDQLLTIVTDALSHPENSYPEPAISDKGPVNNQQRKHLRGLADSWAKELGVSPELLVKRRHLDELVQTGELPQGLIGWREEVVGNRLLAAAKEWPR